MFHRIGKKSKSASAKPLKDLNAILSSAELLSDEKRQELLLKIQTGSALGAPRFEPLGMSLIHAVATHCQQLPETLNRYYAAPGGLIDHALNRTDAALELLKQFIVKEGNEISEAQKLWLYALMTAGILQGIGKLQIDYQVNLHDLNGQGLKVWNPLLESPGDVGRYYHYTFQDEKNEDLRRRLNLLFARMLMPIQGFNWIASNPEVLETWLALLNEDTQSAGMLGAILVRANAISIQRYFNRLMLRQGAGYDGRASRIGAFVDTTPKTFDDREHLIGIEFVLWLMQQLEQGKIMINKAPLYMVPAGLIMSIEMFRLFVREHPEFKNWQAIQKGFLSLGLHQVGADGSVISRFEQAQTQKMLSGIVFSDYAVSLPNEMKIHEMANGKVRTISAIELLNSAQSNSHFKQQKAVSSANPLCQLAGNGQWQPIETRPTQTNQPGNPFNG